MFIKLSYNLKNDDPVYVGNPKNEIKQINTIEKDGFNTHIVKLFTHNGTHIDLPPHYIRTKKDVTSYNINDFIFDNICFRKIDVCPGEKLQITNVDNMCNFLLIKTGMNRKSEDYLNPPYIDENTASYLVGHPNLKCIGIDALSIANPKHPDIGNKAHKILLNESIFIIEDMNLSTTKGNINKLNRIFSIPLFVKGAESFPCTVFGEVNR